MKKLLQINPVLRITTSTGRIMQEIGELAMENGWESYIAYSKGRDGIKACNSKPVPVGNRWSVGLHALSTRLFDRHGLASDKATRELIGEIKRINPDIIHIHNIHGYFLNYKVLFEYLSTCNIPVVWTVHDCWLYTGHCYYYSYVRCEKWKTMCEKCPQQRAFPASYWLDRSTQNFVDKRNAFTSLPDNRLTIVPVSDWIREEMRHSFLRNARFKVIHNGINTDVFTICDTEKVREKYGLQSYRFILLGVASIWSDEKGLTDFIRLAAKLNKEEVLVLVGVTAKDRKKLPSNVIGISRTADIRELAALYAMADVFMNPTWQDNFPTVNLEAIACGTPVVTYRTGGSVEAVTQETGLVVGQGDVDALLQGARLIESRGKAHFQPLCRAYALKHFRKEDRYADYINLYNELLES